MLREFSPSNPNRFLPVCGLLLLSLLGNTGCLASPGHLAWKQSQLIDLTHAFDTDTIVWPTEQNFRLIVEREDETADGYYYASNRLEMPEHGGTHMDAPIHFVKGAQTLDKVPLDRLVGAAIRINVAARCALNRDYLITVQDFEEWEAAHGRIPERMIILLDTGFGRSWPSRQSYLGTILRGPEAVRELHFPGLHPDAAAWLVRERKLKAVGIDTTSIDYGQSTSYETHRVLLSHSVPTFENLADLSVLPEGGFDIVALPMKIAGGSGGPLRIIAVLPATR